MVLFEFILLFFPGLFSALIFFMKVSNEEKQDKEKDFDIFSKISVFLFFIMLDNLISLIIGTKILGVEGTIVDGHLSPGLLSLHYFVIAFIVSVIAGIAGVIIKTNFALYLSAKPLSESRRKTENSVAGGKVDH